MRNLPFLFLGIFFCIALSFTVLVLTSQIQFGALQPVAMGEGEDLYPKEPVGIAQQGKKEYIKLGCAYCHSQQVRRKGFGADHDRGFGDRQTVARDYIFPIRQVSGSSLIHTFGGRVFLKSGSPSKLALDQSRLKRILGK